MFDKQNLVYLFAGAAATYAYVCWRDKQQHLHRKRMLMQRQAPPPGYVPGYAPGLPAPHAPPMMQHPRQAGLMQAVQQQQAQRLAMQALPPAGPGAPPADMPAPVPNSHDVVQTPMSPFTPNGQASMGPPPASEMPMGQDPYESTSGTGYAVEMGGMGGENF